MLDDTGWGYYSWIASGITWAADHGAKVINMSLGGTSASATLESAINYAWNKGVVVAAAAGNNGNSTPFYPAYYSNVIAVASTDSLDNLSPYSNRGDWVDVAAPGGNIWSTMINNNYGYMDGTSMASPHVAGLAGLVFTKVTDTNGNGLLNDEVRNCIQNYADNIGVTGIGSGRINAYKATLCSSVLPTPTPTPTLAPFITPSPTLTPSPIPTLPPEPTSTPTPTPTPPSDTITPTVSITSPLNGSTVTKKTVFTIAAAASDNIGIDRVEFYINNTLACLDSSAPYTCKWRVPGAVGKIYNLQGKAYDPSNNIGSSSIVTVTAK